MVTIFWSWRQIDSIAKIDIAFSVIVLTWVQSYRLSTSWSESVMNILPFHFWHDMSYRCRPIGAVAMTPEDWLKEIGWLVFLFGWLWTMCRTGLHKHMTDEGRLQLIMEDLGVTVDDVETDDGQTDDAISSDEEETRPATHDEGDTGLGDAAGDTPPSGTFQPISPQAPTHPPIPPHTDTRTYKTSSQSSDSFSEFSSLLSSLIRPFTFLGASPSIMVQSAILGFPRMGVNRDLKKATEACKYPDKLISLFSFPS
jgi:hypothetical protein